MKNHPRNAALAIVAAFAAAWLVIDGFLIAPAFGHTDIYYFKDAGLNLAQGLGLTSRFTYGNATFDYRDFSTYPPLYPLIFGMFARAAGISVVANQLFNTLVDIAAGLAAFIALRPVLDSAAGSRTIPVGAAFGILAVLVGFFGPAYDRPDALAAVLGVAALMSSLRGRSRASAIVAGLLCGATLCASPFVGAWTCLLLSMGLVAMTGDSWLPGTTRLLWVALGGASALAVALGAMALWLPGWFGGFSGVATGADTHNETGGGYFLALLHGDVRTWLSGFPYSWRGHDLPVAQLALVMAALLTRIVAGRRSPAETWVWRLVPLAVVAPLCLVTSPYQTHYPPAAAALLLVAWVCIEKRHAGAILPRRAAMAMLAAFAALSIAALPFRAADILVRMGTRDSLHRAADFLTIHRTELSGPSRLVAVSPSLYMLWRQAGLHPVITIYSGFAVPENRRRVDLVALAYPGSGDLVTPQIPEFVTAAEYERVFRPDLPQPATLFGHRVSNSSQTWESAIFARIDCGGCKAGWGAGTAAGAP
jgi:hypothetical protein